MTTGLIRIILVHPQIAENVGFVARNMKAFGLSDLRLVLPEFAWNPDNPAYKTASGARDILDTARLHQTIEEAVAETRFVVGFSRRRFDTAVPVLSLNDWLSHPLYHEKKLPSALLFGKESSGLDRQAIHLCNHIVTITQHDPHLSLNLSHAVAIVLYELFKRHSQPTTSPATILDKKNHFIHQQQVQLLVDRFEALKGTPPSQQQSKHSRQKNILYNFLQHAHITEDEFSVLMGYFKK